ncbi:histidine kinase [Clostridiales bacterium oral taxon 876 str. F0540]|nr:histidine kinase [Clostridiales bacterium oral taxon 876 str. F0540]
MDKKTEKILNIILWIFLIWASIYMLTYKGNNIVMLVLLIGLLGFSLTTLDKLGEILKSKDNAFKINIFLESALIYWIARIDVSGASEILFFILTGRAVIGFSVKYGFIFTLINFLSFIIIDYIKMGYPIISSIVPKVFNYLLNFGFVFGFSFVAKFEILQREKLDKTKKELEKAYEKLQESYDTKEQLLVERERNKIAGEIHDTVGHTLTTVIVELEAAKRLMKKDMELSQEKLELAQEQVRKGLNDIRKSVRALKSGDEILEFETGVVSLIKETEKHSGVRIDYSLDDFNNLDQNVHKVLLRALQEGLTNGIRHGQSSEFKLSITKRDNTAIFTLEDNGLGADSLELGFGLSNMKHRVEQLKGSFKVNSTKNQGCKINIEIPLGKEKIDGQD